MIRSVRDLDVRGKRALVRVDYNVPLLADGSVGDDTRLRATLAKIRHLLDRGASVVLLSHLGRPDGKPDPRYSLRPVAARLAELLGRPVAFDQPGDLTLLENVRFHHGEESNDPSFAVQLAAHGDVFVNDAFGTAHRAHASTVGIAKLLPSAAGLLLEKEVQALSGALESPKRPFVAIVGGS